MQLSTLQVCFVILKSAKNDKSVVSKTEAKLLKLCKNKRLPDFSPLSNHKEKNPRASIGISQIMNQSARQY